MERLIVDPRQPDAAVISRVAAAIRAGKIVALPTDTLYGLAVNPFDADAVDRVCEAKGRPADRALPLVAADVTQVEDVLGPLPRTGRRLARRFWPGPLTLVLRAAERLAPAATGPGGTIAVRVPAHEVPRALCRASGLLVTATSANRSGEPATHDPDVVAATLGDVIDVLVDGGVTPGGAPSTIVDVVSSGARLIRAGAIEWDLIEAVMQAPAVASARRSSG